jgi:methionyl-tRNA formyltransferase
MRGRGVCFLGNRDIFSEPFYRLLERRKLLDPSARRGVVASHGKLLTRSQLESFSDGLVNFHPSLLPAYRGAAPAEWQILNREEMSGITAIRMVPKMDAGPIIAQESYPLHADWSAHDLLAEAARRGVRMLDCILDSWAESLAAAGAQDDSLATFAPKLVRESSACIDWDSWDATEMTVRMRALGDRFGGLETSFGKKRIKLTQLQRVSASSELPMLGAGEVQWRRGRLECGTVNNGTIWIHALRVAGGKGEMNAKDFRLGYLKNGGSAQFV